MSPPEEAAAAHQPVITAAGVISPLGDTPEALHQALCAGDSGLTPLEEIEGEGLARTSAFQVRGFDAASYLGDANLRPLDRTARLAGAAAARALAAGGWDSEEIARGEVGLVLGTMFGSVRTIAEFDRRAMTAGPIYAKPMDFANSVINAAAGQTAILHKLDGVNATLTGGPAAGASALAYAADMIRSGRATAVLAGGADELCFESLIGLERAGLVSGGDAEPRPFDAQRRGCVPGEGAALVMLEDAATARRRGAPVLARVLGHGNAFDPSRGRDPERAAATAARAIHLALADAGLDAAAVGAVSAGASGSVAGDACAARALGRVFDGGAASLPVTAVKSMLGETLGASGGFQTVALVEALRRGRLPGIRGLEDPDEGLPAAPAETRPIDAAVGLVHAAGFDGQHIALVIGRGER